MNINNIYIYAYIYNYKMNQQQITIEQDGRKLRITKELSFNKPVIALAYEDKLTGDRVNKTIEVD